MPSTLPDDAGRRLDRLESYLRQDPQNAKLLIEAFEVAFAGGLHERAEFHLRHAQALGLDRLDWILREVHWLLAQQRWREADALLIQHETALADSPRHATTLAHDVAYIALREGRTADGLARLRPVIDSVAPPHQIDAAIEITWLRLQHRAGELAQAMEWLRQREARAALRPGPAGVGSLIALDDGDYEATLRWSRAAGREPGVPPEALVASASLALASRDAASARTLLAQAMQSNAADGRTWSAMGFAELLDGRLPAARAAFERATALMPEHVGTWHGLGWAAIAQRDVPAARHAFDAALALDRNFAESHGGRAVVAALAGDKAAARAGIDRALGLDAQSLAARYADALLDGDAGDSASVQRLAERLLGGRRGPLGLDMASLLRPNAGRTEANDKAR